MGTRADFCERRSKARWPFLVVIDDALVFSRHCKRDGAERNALLQMARMGIKRVRVVRVDQDHDPGSALQRAGVPV